MAEVELDFDIEAIGFEQGEIDLRIESRNAAKRGKREPPVPAAAGPSVSRAGDLWRLGPHTLRCGEARDGDAPDLPMGSDCADCDVIVRRWQAYTGAMARHGVSGASFDEIARLHAAEAASRGVGEVPENVAALAERGGPRAPDFPRSDQAEPTRTTTASTATGGADGH